MHAELTPEAPGRVHARAFERRPTRTRPQTATIAELTAGEVDRERRRRDRRRCSFATHVFGELGGELALPTRGRARSPGRPNLVFPGLAAGEQLDAAHPGARSGRAILAADARPLAEGPAAARTVGAAASAVVGEVGDADARAQAAELTRRRLPARDADRHLRARARLQRAARRPARRPAARRRPPARRARSAAGACSPAASRSPARPCARTIDPELQETRGRGARRASTAAPPCSTRRRARCSALAGLAYSAPQPPGSTFKIITATGRARRRDRQDLATSSRSSRSNSEIGREIANAHDELCGGTFVADLRRLLQHGLRPARRRARRREAGRDRRAVRLQLAAASCSTRRRPRSSTRRASTIPTELSDERRDRRVGDRPGPGAGDAAGDGDASRRRSPTAASGCRPRSRAADELQPDAEPVEVTSPETAATMRELMVEVVNSGTGVAAALPGIQVAGKTGTAELGPDGARARPGARPGRGARRWRPTPGSPPSPPPTSRRSPSR